MPMELIQLVSGQKSSLPVGDLPRDVAKYLGCHLGIVYLGHKEVLKIVRKHPEIRVEELQCLPFAIALGEYREDAHRECCVTIFYNEPIKNTLYFDRSANIGYGRGKRVSRAIADDGAD
jgi:hypothetical protein